MPGLQPGQLGVGQAGARLGHLGQPEVDRITEDCGQQQRPVFGLGPSFKWVKWRLKPVQSSTSISSSVILMRGSNWLVWSISACARSGTAASSGVIFSPDSVRMASGSSLSNRAGDGGQLLVQQLQTLFRYWSLFGLIARAGPARARVRRTSSAGSRWSSKSKSFHSGQIGSIRISQISIERLPARLDEGRGASAGTCAGCRRSSRSGSARLPARLARRGGAQFQHLQQARRVTAQGGEVLADQVQMVEAFGRASSSASLTLSVNSSQGITASMAA